MGLIRRFVNVFRANRLSRDIDRELEFHIAERADELRAAGMDAVSAERVARRRLGNYTLQKERTREMNILVWLDTARADVRYAVRSLIANPGFSLIAVMSLSLGIGATTAIFGLIDAVLLKTLPVRNPAEIVQVRVWNNSLWWTNPLWEQLRDREQIFAGTAAYSEQQFDLSQGGEARPVQGSYVSGGYFPMLGVRPEAGRLLAAGDDYRGCPAVTVLSAGFWNSEFGAARDVAGRTLMVNGKSFEIVGVADQAFHGVNVGRQIQLYMPMCAEDIVAGPRSGLDMRSRWYLQVLARPKPGVSTAEVDAHLASIAPVAFESTVPEQWPPEYAEDYLKGTMRAEPAAAGASILRTEYSKALLVLMGLVAIVLLIACANVANLLLARATVRQREMAVRMAIGAGRVRIIRQLLTESLLLAAVSATLGIVFAIWCSRALVALLSTSINTVFLDLPVDVRLLGFTLVVSTFAALIFGLAPAWRSGREDPQNALRAGGRGIVTGTSRFSSGKALVVTQIALSLVMIVAAGLLLGTFRTLWTAPSGFERDNVMLVNVELPDEIDDLERQRTVYRPLLEQVRALPGVDAAAAVQMTPIGQARWNDVIFVDEHEAASEQDRLSNMNEVGDGYFTTMGTRVLQGREFTSSDVPGGPRVAVVNEDFARHFFGTPSVVGRSFRFGRETDPPIEIVGVVENAKYESLREETQRIAYLSWSQATERAFMLNFAVRMRGDERAVRSAIVASAERLEPTLALRFTMLERQISDSLARERMLALLSAFLGGLALLLAMIGLYGIMSYNVTRRRNEIGIRIALGSARSGVLRMVLGEAGWLIGAGLVLGAGCAWAGTRLVESFLYGIEPHDARTFVVSAALLGVIGITACVLPAWRASRIEPMVALRDE